jgi:predicted porin
LEKFEMKKTLVALAALAAVGAVSAQSVTLYGKIDTSLVFTDKAGVSTTSLDAGTMSGNRWGMKGTEDLGGGLNAVFQLEGGFTSDSAQVGQSTAGTNPRIFGRQAYVGVSGAFGTLTVGRQYTPADQTMGLDAAGAAGVNGGGAMYSTFCSNFAQIDSKCAGRQDNSINYSLPAMGGVVGNVMMGLDESSTSILQPQKLVGLHVGYSAGPLAIGLSTDNITATNASKSDTGWLLGGNYNFGPAKVSAIFSGGTSVADTVDAGWALGAAIPVGPTTVAISYARETSKASGASAEAVTSAWGSNVIYTLSKRTNVYGSYINKEDTSAANVNVKVSVLGVGMRHDF